jgi:hypothetical protein
MPSMFDFRIEAITINCLLKAQSRYQIRAN